MSPKNLRASRGRIGGEPVVVFSFDPPEPRTHEEASGALSLSDFAALSPAERSVVELVLMGCSRSEIAEHRGTSVGTVGKQIESAFRKLGVGSRAELAARLLL